jgi:hypothetical protein
MANVSELKQVNVALAAFAMKAAPAAPKAGTRNPQDCCDFCAAQPVVNPSTRCPARKGSRRHRSLPAGHKEPCNFVWEKPTEPEIDGLPLCDNCWCYHDPATPCPKSDC